MLGRLRYGLLVSDQFDHGDVFRKRAVHVNAALALVAGILERLVPREQSLLLLREETRRGKHLDRLAHLRHRHVVLVAHGGIQLRLRQTVVQFVLITGHHVDVLGLGHDLRNLRHALGGHDRAPLNAVPVDSLSRVLRGLERKHM